MSKAKSDRHLRWISEPDKGQSDALIREVGEGRIEYIPFPEELKAKYQSLTKADLKRLRDAGYGGVFASIEDGVRATVRAESPCRQEAKV